MERITGIPEPTLCKWFGVITSNHGELEDMIETELTPSLYGK